MYKEWERDSGSETNTLRLRVAVVFVMLTLPTLIVGCEVGNLSSTQSRKLSTVTLRTKPHDAAGLKIGSSREDRHLRECREWESNERGEDCLPPFDSSDNESGFGMVFFTPVNCGESTFRAMIIHTINLTLGLRFGEVRVMNPNLILELGVNCESCQRSFRLN